MQLEFIGVDASSYFVPIALMDSPAIHPVAARALAHFDELFPYESPPAAKTARPEARSLVSTSETAEWLGKLTRILAIPAGTGKPLALDLFAGAGGLALGFEAAGFETVGFEMDADACATYSKNLSRPCYATEITVGFDYKVDPDVIIGGPPCQPFSVIGYQRGPRDPRDGFPTFLDAVERYLPKLAVIENVRGLLYRNRDYLDAALSELKRFGYRVECRLLRATDFGVPQNRERVVIVASQGQFAWPTPTVAKPVPAGIALGELATSAPSDGKYLTPSQDRYIEVYERKSKCVRTRDLHLDRPARTLTCRNLGASTSDMHRIRLPDGRRRMLTAREGARLQSFPDWFQFVGKEYSVAKQIGNAVPPLMAHAIAVQALKSINGDHFTLSGQLEFVHD